MRKLVWTSIVRAVVAVLAAGAFSVAEASGVYDDCVWFFNGGTDGFGGKAVDSAVQKGEIADELHRGTPTHANHQSAVNGIGLDFVREKVPLHSQGMGTQEVSCIKFKTSYSLTAGEGGAVATNFGYTTMKMPFIADCCTGNKYSAIFRLRRDEANPFNTHSWFLACGYTDDYGFMLGFDANGGISFHANYREASAGGMPSVAVPVGKWVEIGVVVDGGTVWLYEAFPGHKGQDWSDYTPINTATYKAWKDKEKTVPKDYTMSRDYIFMGGQESFDTTSLVRNSTHGNTIKFAPVTVHRVAFWNRALTPGEVAEAFAFPRPGLVSLGAANGSSDEFTASAASAVTINASRTEETMQDVPKQICAGDTWTINFNALHDDALNQLLVFTATPGSPAATLAVTLNGAVIAQAASLPAGGKCVVPIRAKYFKSGTSGTKYANTLTIRRTDSGEAVGVDAVWLGGSWNVGLRDNNESKSFSWNGSSGDQFFNQMETFAFQRARNFSSATNASNLWLRVFAPKDVTDRYGTMTFIGRSKVDKVVDGHYLRILENDAELTTFVPTTTLADFSCTLGAGDHRLKMNFVVPTTGPCYWFDCYTLTFDIPPSGTVLLMR